MYHIKFLLHFGILLFYNAVNTQYFINSSQYTSAEKIYLQTDNDIYTTDKTIWFKASDNMIRITGGRYRKGREYR